MARSGAGKKQQIEAESMADDLIIGPDIEIIADPTPDEFEIGSDLSLRLDVDPVVEPVRERAPTPQERLQALHQKNIDARQTGVADRFGPEISAGVGITVLFSIFLVLMLIGAAEQQPAQNETEPAVTPVAPPAEVSTELPEVEIGQAVTLERE